MTGRPEDTPLGDPPRVQTPADSTPSRSLAELRTLEAEIAAELARVQSAIEVLTAPRFSSPGGPTPRHRRSSHLRLVSPLPRRPE